MNKRVALLTFTLTMVSANIFAGGLKAPFDLPSSKVLPKGIRNFNYYGVLADANAKYDTEGNKVVLADPFFKKLIFSDLVNGKRDDEGSVEAGKLKGYLKSNGFNLDDTIGSTTGAVNVDAKANVPILAYGISRKFTLAVAVPIYTIEVSGNSSFQANEALNEFATLLNNDGKGNKANDAEIKLRDPINKKLTDYGYKPLSNERYTKLGDVRVVGKWLVVDKEKQALAFVPSLTLPTGYTGDIDRAVSVPTGDGQLDVGMGFNHDLFISPDFTLSNSVNYTIELADKIAGRVPFRADSRLSPDKDYSIKRDIGNSSMYQVAIKFENELGINTGVSYALQYKEADTFTGSLYEQKRYDWMSAGSIQNMHSAQAFLGYSTLPLFKQKRFPIPLQLGINHTRVLAGKNVTEDPLTALKFSMFF